MFSYHDGSPIDGGQIKEAIIRSDMAPVPETLEINIRLDNANRAHLQEGKDIYLHGERPYRIILTEVSRRAQQQGIRLIERVHCTAVLRSVYPLTFVRERAVYLRETSFTDIYRACGATLRNPIINDIRIPVFHCVVGDTPTIAIAKLFQEHGGILRANEDGDIEFMRLPAIFEQEPEVILPANVTEEVQSGFLERHEIPFFISCDVENNILFGNRAKPRHARYVHAKSEDVLRNMTRVLVQAKRARIDVNISARAGALAELSDDTKLAVLTAAHNYSTGVDGLPVSQYTRLWLGALTGNEA